MQKRILIPLLFLLAVNLAASDKVSLSLQVQGLLPLDQEYTDIYGRIVPGLDARVAWRFFSAFHLWLGAGWAAGFGKIPEFDEAAFSNQVFLRAGYGWRPKLWQKLVVDLHVGGVGVFFTESAMGASTSGWAWGLCGGIELEWLLRQNFYLLLAGDFIYSRKERVNREIYPGGTRIGFGLGWVL